MRARWATSTLTAVLAVGLTALGLGGIVAASASSSARVAPQSNSFTRLDSIAFFNVHDGYGVVVQGVHKCTVRVGATDNSGATFPALTSVASWPCVGNPTVSALAFDDHGDGFLYGPELYVTHDAGVSWQRVPQHGAVLSVEALGYSIWMLETTHFGPDTGFAGRHYRLRLMESSDGGYTWTAVAVPSGAFVWSGDDYVAGLLTRVNLTSAYVGGVSPQVGNRTEHRTPLYFTSNSGASWSNRSVPCMEFVGPMLSVTPQGTAFFECASEPGAGMQQKDTYRSVNGGVTWQMRSGCPNYRCTKGTPVTGYVNEIDAVSSRIAYLVGGRSPLEWTTDGGIDWRIVEPQVSSGDAGGTSQVIFFSVSDGIVLGDGNSNHATLYSTVDGGRHWSARVPRLGAG